MKKISNIILKYIFPISLILIIFLSIYSSRSLLIQKINLPYLEDLYSHSQWSLALSTRIMSDSELYQIAGYRLIKGSSAFSINPEVPPVAKYFYGLGIIIFKNPYLISTLLYLLAIFLFAKLAFTVLTNKKQAKTAIILFCLSPILVSQISQTMLDLPQLVFLLAHVLAIIYTNNANDNKKYLLFLTLSGISLGLFAASKIPLVVLAILLADFLFIKKSKRMGSLIYITLTVGFVYFLSYAPTLIIHQISILNWLKNQKWMIHFYASSELKSNPLYYLSAILLGQFKGAWEHATWQYVQEWTILWPISILAAIILKIKTLSKRHFSKEVTFINNVALIILLIYSFFPFWSRYFLLIIPFLIISLIKMLETKKVALCLLKIISAVWFIIFLIPSPQATIQTIEDKFSSGNYQDFYHLIETDVNIDDFFSILKNVEVNTKSKNMSLKFEKAKFNLFKQNYQLLVESTYPTPVGTYKQVCPMIMKKKFNQWKVFWNWDCLYPNFQVGDTLEITIVYASQGTLFNQDGTVLSHQTNKDFMMLNTKLLKSGDNQLTKNLATMMGIDEPQMEKLIFIDYRGTEKAPIGFVPKNTSETTINELKENPAVLFEKRPDRVYSSKLDSESIGNIKSLESQYQQLLGTNGGQLSYIRGETAKVLLLQDSINGSNVILEKDIFSTQN